jgi:hypothetical protein
MGGAPVAEKSAELSDLAKKFGFARCYPAMNADI